MSAMMTLWVRAGERAKSGLQTGAADVMREGQGEGHGEGQGDRWGEGKGDAALEDDADFAKMEDFSKELDLQESLTDTSGLNKSRWCLKPGQVWCPEVGWPW